MDIVLASRRYFKLFIPAMIVYLIACLGAAYLDDLISVSPVLEYGLVLIAIVALFTVFWTHWRFMNEIDEFLRMIQMKAVMIGLFVVLCIATGWGMLEMYLDAPVLAIFWLNPIFWAGYGLSAGVMTKRAGGIL